MFEEVLFMIIFALVSVVISYLLLNVRTEPLRTIVRAFAMIGIVIHELFHILMCFITHTPIRDIKFLEKTKPKKSVFEFLYGGRVEVKYPEQITFLQGFLIGFAPLYLSFWLFSFLLDQLNHVQLSPLVGLLYVILMISLTISAAPSAADLISVIVSFSFNWSYSFYQLSLLGLSIATFWMVIPNYQPPMFHEILSYVLIGLIYFGYKYGFKAIKVTIMWLIPKIKREKNWPKRTEVNW